MEGLRIATDAEVFMLTQVKTGDGETEDLITTSDPIQLITTTSQVIGNSGAVAIEGLNSGAVALEEAVQYQADDESSEKEQIDVCPL